MGKEWVVKLGSLVPSHDNFRFKGQSSPEEEGRLSISLKGEGLVGSLFVERYKDCLVVRELRVDKPGLVSKRFLQSLSKSLNLWIRKQGLRRLAVDTELGHESMYTGSGFRYCDEEESVALGDTELCKDYVARDLEE
jgi:hypothetical protein